MNHNRPLTAAELAALHAWVLILQRVPTDSRRAVAIAAIGDVGAGAWISCSCLPSKGRRYSISAAYRHLTKAPGPHHLTVDPADVELVQS